MKALDGTDLSALLPAVARIARAAGAAIRAIAVDDMARARKTDGSPVTAADHASERAILPALAALTPAIPVVSEEAVAAGRIPDVSSGTFWLVDPLDGTREYVAGNGEYAVCIGLVDGFVPVLGVLHGPARDVTWAGAGPGTATRAEGDGAPAAIACRRPAGDGLDVLASRSHGRNDRIADFIAARGLVVRQRDPLGSALKFARVAEGGADLYPRLGPTSEWDTAAGHALVLAAGGRVETLDGGALRYGKPGFLNPDFLVWGAR
ncbi:MAG: 3'(2'),5'-bisphosphate nucleotidase CysQ [Alphaproteobacteria bacterium]